ncbi:MAG: FAD-linked oxidase C-terminal domain-containing protein, partial [Deferribacterota bacterium]|nr:FAD-linked oxidase C-terminal domain-containing protein [Deferribacterota bacterium]
RKAAAPMLYKLRGDEKTTHLIESAAIPVSQLVNYFKLMYEILEKYGLKFSIIGHIGKGVVHTEPRLNLKNKRDVELLKILSDEASDLVISLGGTISGEHGEGLNRSYYIKKQYPTIYKLFLEVKKILESYNILNPYIKTYFDENQVKERLRFGKDYSEHNIVEDMNFNWSYRDFITEIDMCNGCSNCTIPTNILRMCPVYKFDFDEISAPKSKANILRGLISGELKEDVIRNPLFKAIMERCINCGACTIECPSNVNVPKLSMEAKAIYYKNQRIPLFYRLSSNLDYAKILTPLLVRFNNYFTSLGLVSNSLSKLINIGSDIKKIKLAENNLFKKYKNHSNKGDRKILLFSGCYYNYIEPDISLDTINILERHGFQVILPDQFCCGIPAVSKGLVDLAKKKIIKNIEKWGDIVHDIQYIVSACSSCTYALKNLWKSIIDDEIIYEISRKTKLISEVLIDIEFKKNKYNDKEKRKALYHEPCHLKFQSGKNFSLELLKKLEYLEVQSLDSNCCGMAGSWGMYNKNSLISQKIGDDLKNRINKKGRDGYYLLLTDCPSCRMRLKSISKKPVLHPVELLDN